MWLIVGLGNPGPQYAATRHNIGFMVLDRLIDRLAPNPLASSRFHGDLFKKGSLLLLKPTTYMNRSGISVEAVAHFYKIDMEKIIVVHDDLDLPFGALRFKRGGGSGGHNGLKSIDEKVGNGYARVRMVIGKPAYKSQVADYVLHPFDPDEVPCLPEWIDRAADATIELTERDVTWVASHRTIRKPAECPGR
jgi:PTH1 family peptidyl-tRNA hydrolase